jgi:hypothetical protein
MYSPVGFSCAVCKYHYIEDEKHMCSNKQYQEYKGTAELVDDEGNQIKDPTKFKAAHDVLLKELKDDFTGRDVGFGTYDIGRPNGATHWMYLSGKDGEDHLKLYDKLEKSAEFWKYIKDRGEVIDVKDFELKYLKIKQ